MTDVRDTVVRIAGDRCEYCLIPQSLVPFHTFHIEHIVARQHGGSDSVSNRCLSCPRCNAYKGPNLTTISSKTGEVVRLYNPREQSWNDHFSLRGAEIVGQTETGRGTADLLHMNDELRMALREELLALGQLRI